MNAPPSAGRRRDRQVYLRSHPFLFAVLVSLRRMPTVRLGRHVVVNSTDGFVDALTRVPLDRTAVSTTGGSARRFAPSGSHLFDQDAAAHRASRRTVALDLGSAGVARLRPVWQDVLDRGLAPLGDGRSIDVVDIAAEIAGRTALALLELEDTVDSAALVEAARAVAATAARSRLTPGLLHTGRRDRVAQAAVDRLHDLVGTEGSAAVVAAAAVNTSIAALPRAAAWCADDDLWHHAEDSDALDNLVTELLRVTAPSPVLPRAASGPGTVSGRRIVAGDRLILVARHAADPHGAAPDPAYPVPSKVSQLVFGTGSHACPGAQLARRQLADLLSALARHRPTVVRARVDRSAALPSWASLVMKAGVS